MSSGGNSKRNFNSISSNSPIKGKKSSSNSNDKRKKTQQKTLGAAWGSNSRSSSRSAFQGSPFSDVGSYMEVKNRKLHHQFDAEASTSHSGLDAEKCIFHGVSIFVDGFTVPSNQELRGYMLKHGGRFENYFSRHHVTHIICSNLPDSKIKNLRSFSGGLPVVKATWVLDSVAAKKLLSWVPYQIDQLAHESRSQPKLSAFFTPKTCRNGLDAANGINCHVIPEKEDSVLEGGTSKEEFFVDVADLVKSPKQYSGQSDNAVCPDSYETSKDESEKEDLVLEGGTSKEEILVEVDNLVKSPKQCSGGSDNAVCPDSYEASKDESTSSHGNPCEDRLGGISEADTEIQSSLKHECSPLQTSSSADDNCLGNNNINESRSSVLTGPSNSHCSTSDDPNFVENYFKSSRLHFIGTWRNRYRKRFMGSFTGIKSSSDFNASSGGENISILHLDMDCFFVSVVIRNRPDLIEKPVAVCHSDNPKGTSEISSANYPARNYGVRAGMFVRDAKALCAQLVIVPYNFVAYEEVADQFYNILHQHSNKVQAVSCDEAFIEVAESETKNPEHLASVIRKEVFEATGCTASAGIAGNMLMARLATRTAKPDGQYYISPDKVEDYLCELPIKQLPGIGRVLEEKLKTRQILTCGQLRMISKETLQKDFGIKTGDMLWSYCRGVDNRLVGFIQESKSIGAEVNWGVRFKDLKDSHSFLMNLCKEVSLRLQGSGVQGRTFTLKIKKRRKEAKEPVKYMGHGDCENLSHNMTVPLATDDLEVLQRISKQLFGAFHIDVKEIRGVGLQVSRLENADTTKQGSGRNSIKSWLTSVSATPKVQCNIMSPTKQGVDSGGEKQRVHESPIHPRGESVTLRQVRTRSNASSREFSDLPSLCHLDMEVIKNLPSELFSELNKLYGGKLIGLIAKEKGCEESVRKSTYSPSSKGINDAKGEGHKHASCRVTLQKNHNETEVVPISAEGCSNMVLHTSHLDNTDLMPSSLSQVDPSVLQELPEELRGGILEALPAHRMGGQENSTAFKSPIECPAEELDVKDIESNHGLVEFVTNTNIWSGNPPKWVNRFKISNCFILKTLGVLYSRLNSGGPLSCVLQRTFSQLSQSSEQSYNDSDETIKGLSELLKQYIKLKIESDIEEIYACFCLLKRSRMKSRALLEVYNSVYPYIQLWRELSHIMANNIKARSLKIDHTYQGSFYLQGSRSSLRVKLESDSITDLNCINKLCLARRSINYHGI